MQRNGKSPFSARLPCRTKLLMGFLDALDHLVNFLLPALGMAVLVPSLARLVWWKELKGKGWTLQVTRTALANGVVLILGLLVLGRDGAMMTYAALVLSSALMVWWTGLR